MQESLLIRTPSEASAANIDPEHAPRMPRRKRVLLADPSHYRIEYAINPHMRSADGTLKTLTPGVAAKQWEALKQTYEELGLKVEVLPSVRDHPDLVFAANQAFPYPDPTSERSQGAYCFIPSRMAHEQRAGEVELVSAWLRAQGYRETPLPPVKGTFEGGGDLTWFGDRRILVGGVSSRTSASSLKMVTDLINIPLVALDIDDPDFYHLDTCLNFLDGTTAIWVPHAFRTASQKILKGLVENLVAVDDLEARNGLAVNCHSPDGRRVIIQKGNQETIATLENLGYDVIEVDTSEFIKAGGSVYCLKMMLW
ncbi:MAG: amidinotransferase [Euryarchaeota archaeon]|nr:amidinotransferase [Euryarchaeota archaeon]